MTPSNSEDPAVRGNGGGYVFLITNTVDQKVFVGYSTRKINLVKNSYWFQAVHDKDNQGSRLFDAMRRGLREDFAWSVLVDGIDDLDELIKVRREYIDILGSADPEVGYNTRDGVSVDPSIRSKKSPRFICVETGEVFASIYEIQAKTGCSRTLILKEVRENGMVKGRHYRLLGEVTV